MNLLIKFTDQSQSFTNGVEFGRLWERMERGEDLILNNGFPIHIENVEVLTAMCHKLGYVPTFGAQYYGEWVEFMGIKKTTSEN